MKPYMKNIAFVALGAFLVTGVTVFAATWQGTSSIKNGTVIEPDVIQENLDYLYERVEAFDNLDTYIANVGEDDYGPWGPEFVGNFTRTSDQDTCHGNAFAEYTCPRMSTKSCVDIIDAPGWNDFRKRDVQCKQFRVYGELIE